MATGVYFLILITLGVQGREMEGPENTVAINGSIAIMKCSSDTEGCKNIEWQLLIHGSPTYIFRDGVRYLKDDRYSVDNSSGCNLVIKNVQLTDAGHYLCSSFIGQRQVQRSAHLIVLKSEQTCKVNATLDDTAEGEAVQLTCEVTVNGTDKTSMTWTGVKDASVAVPNGKTLIQYYTVARGPEVPSFECLTSFEFLLLPNAASNIPTTSCKTPAIQVLYPVRNVQLSPSLPIYFPGSTVQCSAEGNPNSTYKWQELLVEHGNNSWKDISGATGDTFVASNASYNQYRCFVSNVIRGVTYSNFSHAFKVNYTDDEEKPANNLVGASVVAIAAGVSAGVLVLLMLIVLCFCIRACPGYKCCHSKKKKVPTATLR